MIAGEVETFVERGIEGEERDFVLTWVELRQQRGVGRIGGSRAGFDLQLSGHTHAGQFFPWTLAVRLVHAPHVAGLSREGRMWVYVSAGTGTWGPPVRFGTQPELTIVRLRRTP